MFRLWVSFFLDDQSWQHRRVTGVKCTAGLLSLLTMINVVSVQTAAYRRRLELVQK